jgi:hypothetical protein
MTLHGGGGGIISTVTDGISNALGTAGGESGILGGLADFDDAVASSVDGGWGGLAETAAVMTATYFGGPLGGAAVRGALDYTHGGEDRENALRNAAEQAAVSYAGSYGGPLGAGAAKAGFQYTHGGKDREKALQAGLIAGGTQLALQGAKDYFSDGVEANVIDNSDYGYSPDYTPDSLSPDVPAPNISANNISAPVSEAPKFESPDIFDDGYSQNLNPDYSQVPGEPNFSIAPAYDQYLGAIPTSNIPTDMPPGTQFEGPDGTEIVAPNGKTYLMRDLESALANSNQPVLPQATPAETLTNISDTSPKTIVQPTDNLNPQVKLDPEEVFKVLAETPYDSGAFNPAEYNAADKEFFKYNDPLTPDQVAANNASAQKQADMGMMERLSQMPEYAYDMAKLYPYVATGLGLAALNSTTGNGPLGGILGGKKSQPTSGSPTSATDLANKKYSGGYGSAGNMYDPYALRNRVNAQNVYGYSSPISRYADGGEVKRFGLGGLSNAVTRFTQPIEKAIVRPIGDAVPFLREAAPYAGLIAAPFIASPAMAAGVGALSSGFGKPGSGFNMKRAMMGGIAAYGMSNLGAGVEAAGTTPAMADTGTGFTTGSMDAALNTPNTTSSGFFRDPDAMSAGVKNLAGGNTYNQAATQFATRAGLPSAGMALMGTSGVMAVDEGIQQQKAADAAAATAQGENQEVLNRIAAGKKRAEQAVKANPYMYAMGGSVDDEYGMDEARGLNQGNLQNGFMGGMPSYADGGMIPSYDLALRGLSQPAFNEGAVGGMQQFAAGGTPRFLSGGGDGMSDSIPATIEGNQEARLADGEFVIPADVVSHLGNGSSKAGAKQLYSMMDRVRQARVGTKKQGREIKPKKFMPV